jgi:DNA-binding CsgD family transcriptional regulator
MPYRPLMLKKFYPLSPREREVLMLLANGATVQEVADQLGLSIKTIGSHIWNMREKYALPGLTHLIIWAWRSGLMGCTCQTQDGMIKEEP